MSHDRQVDLPAFGLPQDFPQLPLTEYRQRLERTRQRMQENGLDFLVVYADREHSANLAYLTGFDPRFEEALLLIDARGPLLLLVGNECMGYLPDPALAIPVEMFQELSLLGQPRERSRPLTRIVAEFGIGHGARVGCAGWKYYRGNLVDPAALEIPSFLVDLLRDAAGGRALVVNAGDLFMDPATGLRCSNSAAQLAQFEYAAAWSSQSVWNAVRALAVGVSERELSRQLFDAGLPRSCHAMTSFGEKARRGLSSPGDGRARQGEAFTICLGVQGALTCRAGMIAAHAADLPANLREFYPALVANYFEVVVLWYRQLKVGASAAQIAAAVAKKHDPALYQIALNPGHLIHLDEWLHSPFAAQSQVALASGMALQMDIIPISNGPFCCTNAEDGVALADADLRRQIAQQFPQMWQRVQARRKFMADQLNIHLDESVLPLSNTAAALPPFALDYGTVLVAE